MTLNKKQRFSETIGILVRVTPDVMDAFFRKGYYIECIDGIPHGFNLKHMGFNAATGYLELLFATDKILEGSSPVNFEPVFDAYDKQVFSLESQP